VKTALRISLWITVVVLALAAALLAVARIALTPRPGEWSTTVNIASRQFDIGVPSAIRLATAQWVGPLLHGRRFRTSHGPVRLAWIARTETLVLHCAPCTAQLPGTGGERITVPELQLTVRRDFHLLSGEIHAGPLRGQWQGVLDQRGLKLSATLPDAPIAYWYAALAPGLPELKRAHIEGTLAMTAQLALPSGRLQVNPRLAGFRVSGLGTQEWATARSCGRKSRLAADSWLARAVVAAEDQRFMEHGGWDIAELTAAFNANQAAGTAQRGGSTLSQQLAKLLVTGDERTLARKLRELLYAVEMEETLGKARILRLYLDNAPWGPGTCGAEAAARKYFAKPARELDAVQAVWLAAMLHNPGLELQRWGSEGHINMGRAEWVAQNLRGMSRAQKASLRLQLAAATWPAPGMPIP
jgi:penicillin-binding protein 1A